jgi:endonuclease/exonuclease/phosphatase family metal-dependent hydrolase
VKTLSVIRIPILIFDKKSREMRNLPVFIIIIFLIVTDGCSDKPIGSNIKVMTLNVRYDNPEDSIYSWPKRASQVCDFILTEKPDILGLQEVLWNHFQVLGSILMDYSSVGAGSVDGAREGEMNPVFFRKDKFNMIRHLTFWLSDSPDIAGSKVMDSSLPRIVTWMELVEKKSHKHFFFFNTHFADDSDSARLLSSKILLKEANKIADGFPFIISGDFNMTPASTGYSILTGPDESVPLLKDSYILSEKNPSGPVSTINSFSDKVKAARIDYIFVRNGMKVLDYKTMIKQENGISISDHWPVETVISIN